LSERRLTCADFDRALDDLRGQGFRLDSIYPADDPHTATLSRGAERVRLTTHPDAAAPSSALPPFAPEFKLTRGAGESDRGRAGMFYRDLIPGRLGGRYVASLISIPDGGPVADWVHFHRVALQLICVRSGWVRVVYEGQGAPFVMHPGDLVLQPPGIRHRVLDSSPGLEVIELSGPALHETLADHDLSLPTPLATPDREFGGQRFARHVAAGSAWSNGFGGEVQETAIEAATGGLAAARMIRATGGRIEVPAHPGELAFGCVMAGSARLEFDAAPVLGPADAFVIPPHSAWALGDVSPDFVLLNVTTTRLG